MRRNAAHPYGRIGIYAKIAVLTVGQALLLPWKCFEFADSLDINAIFSAPATNGRPYIL